MSYKSAIETALASGKAWKRKLAEQRANMTTAQVVAELRVTQSEYEREAELLFAEADHASRCGLHSTASELHTLGLLAHVRASKLSILIGLCDDDRFDVTPN